MKTKKAIKEIEALKFRGAWANGVKKYALMLLENYEEEELPKDTQQLEKTLLNGAKDWKQYSWGASGVSLVYNGDIAKMLCNASELKRTKCGSLSPNRWEQWPDTQARALKQAFNIIADMNRARA